MISIASVLFLLIVSAQINYPAITVTGEVVSDIQVARPGRPKEPEHYVFEFKVHDSSDEEIFREGDIIRYVWMDKTKFNKPSKANILTITGCWSDTNPTKEGYFMVESLETREGNKIIGYLILAVATGFAIGYTIKCIQKHRRKQP